MIAVVGALKDEIAGLRDKLAVRSWHPVGSCHIWEGQIEGAPVVVARVGPGRERVEFAASYLMERYPLSGILSWGFGGGLVTEVRSGQVVICSRAILSEDGPADGQLLNADAELFQRAMQVARDIRVSARDGVALTVPRIISEPEEKAELGRRYAASVAEMEAYWVGQVAAAHGIPFLAVRAISDELKDWMPDVHRFVNAAGAVQAKRAMQYLAANPDKSPALMRLGMNVRRASNNLTKFGIAFLPAVSSEVARHG